MARNRFMAALAAAALAAVPLAAATPAFAITSDDAVKGALPDPRYGGDGFGGYSTGTVLFLNALNAETQELARISEGQSAAGAVVDEEFVDVDRLGSRILFAEGEERAGKNAYGHGAGLNVGLGGDPTNPEAPQGTLALVEALSPPPDDPEEDIVVDVPDNPLLTADVLSADAAAFTTSPDSLCNPASEDGRLLSEGEARVADASALNPGETPEEALIRAPGEAQSISQMSLVGDNPFGLTAVTTQTIAELILLNGTPIQTEIDVLEDIQLRATATGTPGGADVFFGAVDENGEIPREDNQIPIVRLLIGQDDPLTEGDDRQVIELTSEDLFGEEGFNLNLGFIQIRIGGPVEDRIEEEDGTRAFGAADFIRVRIPSEEPIDSTPFAPDSPFAGLNGVLTPIIEGATPVFEGIEGALEGIVGEAGAVVDLRVLHFESLAVVPVGGIDCTEDPFADARKDASTDTVVPGQEFDYVITFTNMCSGPLTDTRIVDTFSSGLEYLRGTGTAGEREFDVPDEADGNVITIDVGEVPSGDVVRVVLTFRVPANAADGTVFRNDADLSGVCNGQQAAKRVTAVGPTVDGPARVLARTGAAALLPALGLVAVGGALVARRRFSDHG